MPTTPKSAPLGKGKLGFAVTQSYPVPVAKVWDAITKAKHTQKYFVWKVKGDFTAKRTPVMWSWRKFGTHALHTTKFQAEKKLEFVWQNWNKKYMTTVTFTLAKKGRFTKVQITERGWTNSDLTNVLGNCEGWTQYLAYLKAYLLYGKDLRSEK